MSVVVSSLHGTRVISSWTKEVGFDVALTPGTHLFECTLKDVRIRPGQTILLNLWMSTAQGTLLDAVDNAIVLDVTRRRQARPPVDQPGPRHRLLRPLVEADFLNSYRQTWK